MRLRPSAFAAVPFVVGLLFAAAPLPAQNLVQNPGFATDLGGWVPFMAFDVTEQWSSVDAGGDTHSGSIQGTLPAIGTFRIPIYATQCVVVQPNTTYTFSANILLPAATTPADAYATIFVNTYANTGCFNNPTMNIVAPNVTAVDAWTGTSAPVTTGAMDQSIQINLRVSSPSNTALTSYFDDVFLGPAAATPVRLQAFDVE